MCTYHVFVDVTSNPRRFGVTPNDPPVTGGVIVDSFEHEEAPHNALLRIAEQRNGPLRLETRERGTMAEQCPATDTGLDEAMGIGSSLADAGSETQLATSKGTMIHYWGQPIAVMQAVREYVLSQKPRFAAKGYSIAVRPHGQLTLGGHRGIILVAHGGVDHTLSLEADIDAMQHVRLLIDGRPHEVTGGAMFPMPADLRATVAPVIDWFINEYLSEV
jgi:hypothetical protein